MKRERRTKRRPQRGQTATPLEIWWSDIPGGGGTILSDAEYRELTLPSRFAGWVQVLCLRHRRIVEAAHQYREILTVRTGSTAISDGRLEYFQVTHRRVLGPVPVLRVRGPVAQTEGPPVLCATSAVVLDV